MLVESAIEVFLKTFNHCNPEHRQKSKWKPLYNKIIKVQCNKPNYQGIFSISNNGIEMHDNMWDLPHIIIRGSASDFIQYAIHSNPGYQTQLNISGPTRLLALLRAYWYESNINGSDLLRPYLGDDTYFLLKNEKQRLHEWLQDSSTQTLQAVGDYITKPDSLCASREELQLFYQQVDTLHARAERLLQYINNT